MARTGQIPKRRGFQHYAFSEIEAHHLAYLRDFLSFIYGQFEGVADYWAVLTRLLFNLTLKAMREARPKVERELVGLFSVGELERIQQHCQSEFRAIMDQLSRNEPVVLKGVAMSLSPMRLVSGDEVFWCGVGLPRIESAEDIVRELLVLLRWSLMYLRREAILQCQECGRYFLRRDARTVEYCSPRCRYLIANRRRQRRPQERGKQRAARVRRK